MLSNLQTSGKMEWDYNIGTLSLGLHPPGGRVLLEIILVLFLTVNCLAELNGTFS